MYEVLPEILRSDSLADGHDALVSAWHVTEGKRRCMHAAPDRSRCCCIAYWHPLDPGLLLHVGRLMHTHHDNFLRFSRYQDPFKRASSVRTRSLHLLQDLQKPPFCIAGAVGMALVALSVAHSDDGRFEKFTMPQPTWYTEAPLEASNSRSLQAATASCVIRITGTGALRDCLRNITWLRDLSCNSRTRACTMLCAA